MCLTTSHGDKLGIKQAIHNGVAGLDGFCRSTRGGDSQGGLHMAVIQLGGHDIQLLEWLGCVQRAMCSKPF